MVIVNDMIDNGICITAVYDKRDSFNISIVNFPYLSSNIPSSLLMECTFPNLYIRIGII